MPPGASGVYKAARPGQKHQFSASQQKSNTTSTLSPST
nr:diacylglycerol kinase N-terminus [White spot syndrome virus]